MQHDKAHSLPDSLRHAIDHRILNAVVRTVAPPKQHVGRGQDFGRQAMLRLFKRGRANFNGRAESGGKCFRDRAMNSLRINRLDLGLRSLVDEFVPNRDANHGKETGVREQGTGRDDEMEDTVRRRRGQTKGTPNWEPSDSLQLAAMLSLSIIKQTNQ